uniref:Uncharacterized protein n=1 Tax=Klebsiella pneumoniae TaxID=573 RepID=A0A8B0SNC7_KLEPN|nr:hypothetical protein [Klebsiella pneumoniae]
MFRWKMKFSVKSMKNTTCQPRKKMKLTGGFKKTATASML